MTDMRMLQKRGTAAEWIAANPVLGDGEIGYERDTGIIKLGDGVTPWTGLSSPDILKSIIDSAGDLVVGTGDNTYGRLVRGTTNQRLTVAADGTLVWQTPTLPSIFDAVGDLVVGTGNDAAGRLAAGTPGQRLTVAANGTLVWRNGGLTPELSTARPSAPYTGQVIYETDTGLFMIYNGTAWEDMTRHMSPLMAVIHHANNFSVPNAVAGFTGLSYDSEFYDKYNMHSVVSSVSRLVAPINGYYEVDSQMNWATNGVGRRLMKFVKGGTTDVLGSQVEATPSSSAITSMYTRAFVHLNATEWVETFVYQNSGAALNTAYLPPGIVNTMSIKLINPE